MNPIGFTIFVPTIGQLNHSALALSSDAFPTIETDTVEKPNAENIDPDDCVGIDFSVLNFSHDSDGRAVSQLDLSEDRERLECE